MTIKELREKLTGFTDEERGKYLMALMKKLSAVSLQTIRNVQDTWDWDNNPPPEGPIKFFKKQNEVIIECLRMEQSDIGIMVRGQLGLSPLKDEEELE